MAVHNVAAGEVAVHDFTLTADTVDAVNFADDPDWVRIVTDGAAAVYVSTDGSTPTVGGANTHIIAAVASETVLRHGGNPRPVKLISSGTPTLSVESV